MQKINLVLLFMRYVKTSETKNLLCLKLVFISRTVPEILGDYWRTTQQQEWSI